MKKILLVFLVILLASGGLAYATATSETLDSRAKPLSAYGKTSGGVVTAIQVDSSGAVVISGGGGGSGSIDDGTVDNQTTRWDQATQTWEASSELLINESTGTVTVDGDLTVVGSAYASSIVLTGAGGEPYTLESSTDYVYINDNLTVENALIAHEVFSVEDIYFPLDFDISVNGSNMVNIAFPVKDMQITQVRVLADSPIAGDLTVTCFVGATEFTSGGKPFVDSDGIGAWITGLAQIATENDLFKVQLDSNSITEDLTATGYLHIRGRGRDRI